MENKALIDFLVYSYFGIVPKELYLEDNYSEYCLRMIIMKAYADATNQGAYNALFKKTSSDYTTLKQYSANAKKEGAQLTLKAVEELKDEKSSFDNWHKALCTDLVKAHENVKENGIRFFTYGNAQKWVNMTLKYIFLLHDYCGEYGEKVLALKDTLHVPLDSYIISALKNENVRIDENWSQIRTYDASENDNKKTYSEYVKNIRNAVCSPFEWENVAWIKQAEKEKKNDKVKKHDSFWN